MKAIRPAKKVEGIVPRHSRSCPAKDGWGDMQDCTCAPSWQAWVSSPETGKIRKAFKNHQLAEAKSWRRDALTRLERKTLRAPSKRTIDEGFEALFAGMRYGTVRKKGGKLFKPSTIRGYKQIYANHLRLRFGALRLDAAQRRDFQDFVDEMVAQDEDSDSIQNRIMPLRVLFRKAVRDDEVSVNPTRDLEMPARDGARDRFADPAEAAKRIEALPGQRDQALWATFFYTGMDNGEMQALQVEDIDLEAGIVSVSRNWDKVEGFNEIPKTDARVRKIPICQHLRRFLEPHLAGREGFAFGGADGPYPYWDTLERANKAWADAGFERFTFHDGRRSFRTYLDSIPAISEVRADRYAGHTNASMRARYTKQMENHFADDAAALDAYLTAYTEGRETGTVVPFREAI